MKERRRKEERIRDVFGEGKGWDEERNGLLLRNKGEEA